MLDQYDELTEAVKETMLELMWTFYNLGITEVHMGGVMRILGVSNEDSARHDNEYLILDERFAKYMQASHSTTRSDTDTLH